MVSRVLGLLILTGLLIPHPARGIGHMRAGVGGEAHELLELTSVVADVAIRDRMAVTRVDQVFTNPLDRTVEGIYEFSLPTGAVITDLALWIEDRRVQGFVVGRDTARRFYDRIVRRQVDPALLEQVDESLFRLSIYPFPPGGSRRVELEYMQTLPAREGALRYSFPLAPESGTSVSIGAFGLRLSARAQHPFSVTTDNSYGSLAETTYTDDEHTAELSFTAEQLLVEDDLTIDLTPVGEEVRPTVMSAPPRGTEDSGHFALWLPPIPELEAAEPGPMAVSFAIDVSSSMGDGRLGAVKRALHAVVEELAQDDLFNIVLFGNRAESLYRDPVPATTQNKQAASAFIEAQGAMGATHFEAALRELLQQAVPPGTAHHVVFLTDGSPTLGETDPIRLSEMVAGWTGSEVRLYTVGIGDQVDASFLRGLAEDQRGTVSFPARDEEIEAALGGLFDEFSRAVFLDVNLVYEGSAVHDLLPRRTDMLRPGQELSQVGRYTSGGPLELTLTGWLQGRELSLVYPLEFAVAEPDAEQEPVDAPLLLDEGFDDGVAAQWQQRPGEGGRWSVDAERGYLQVTELDGEGHAFLIPPLLALNYTIETRMRLGSWEGKVVYSHANQHAGFRIDLMASHDLARLQTQLGLFPVPFPLESHRWYTVRVEVSDGMINTYIDGTQCHYMVPFGAAEPDGQIGVGSYGPTHGTQFDYVRVFRGAAGGGAPLSAEPIARLWAHRKVQALESQMERYGIHQEMLDAILRLGLDYRLVTRMTSLFAPEEGLIVDPTGQEGDEMSPITAIEEDEPDTLPSDLELPTAAELMQNVPNPFNAATAITFRIPHGVEISEATLTIYNLAGQRVRSWDLASVTGERRLVWGGLNDAGEGVASGVYIYRLESRTFSLSHRMLLLR